MLSKKTRSAEPEMFIAGFRYYEIIVFAAVVGVIHELPLPGKHTGFPLRWGNGYTYPNGVIFIQLGVTPRATGLDALCAQGGMNSNQRLFASRRSLLQVFII